MSIPKIITDSILNNYGVALKNLKEFNTAKYYFKKSIKINQKNFLAFFNLGNLNYEIGKEKEAEISSREATIQKFQVTMVGPEGELYRRQAQLEFDILSKVKRAVDKIAAAKKIDFIIDGSTSLLYGNPTHDLTDDVLLELRKYSVSDKKKTDTKN